MSIEARVTAPQSNTGSVIRDSALGLVPETLEPYIAMSLSLWADGPLRPADLEIARLRNARKVNCVFCRSVRYDIAKADGLSEHKVEQIDDAYQSSDLNDREKLIIEYTDQYLNDPAAISDCLKTRFCAMFNEAERVQLSMAIVLFNCFSRCAVSLGGMPDELPVMEIAVPT
mgnify:CR=1 FL=1